MSSHTTLTQLLVVAVLLSTTQGQSAFDMCSGDWDCSSEFKCIDGNCNCPPNTHYSGFACRNNSVTGLICKSDADCGGFKGTVCRGPANHSTCACRESWQTVHIYTLECMDSQDIEEYVWCEKGADCMVGQTCETLYTGYRICMNESSNNNTGDYYKKCNSDWDCSDTFKCIESYCTCPATTVHSGFHCRKQADTGIVCKSDADCTFYKGTSCIGTATRSTCACPDPWQIMNTHTFECVDRGLLQSCDNDTHCSMGLKCELYYGSRLCINETDATGDYKKYCKGDWECSSPFKCIGSYCDCPSKTTYNGPECQNDSDSGRTCKSDVECKFYNGTACIGTATRSTCACPHPWQKINRWTSGCVNRELNDPCDNDTDCLITHTCELVSSGFRLCMGESFINNTDTSLDMPCLTDQQCRSLTNHSICDVATGACACDAGFYVNEGECNPILGENCTGFEDMCGKFLDGSECLDDVCVCTSDRFEAHYQCMSSMDCVAHVNPLPEMDRRSPSYHAARTEVLINDGQSLGGGWYDLGHHMLSTNSTVRSGDCATRYPVYMTGATNISLEDGETVEREVIIGGNSGINETYPVSIRTCGAKNHVLLPRLPIAYTGFCLDSKVSSGQLFENGKYSVKIDQLLYFEEQDGDFVPGIQFNCTIEQHVDPYDKGSRDKFITANWYVNRKHCKTYGPVPLIELNKLMINESVILDECDVTALGFELQCSLTASINRTGKPSQPETSDYIFVGEIPRAYSVEETGKAVIAMSPFNTPVGCKGNSSDFTCEVEYKLNKGGICSGGPKCGVRLQGLTKAGLDRYGSWQTYAHSVMQGLFFSIENIDNIIWEDLNGTATKHLIDADTSDDMFVEKYCAPEGKIGHRLWDSFALPDVKVRLMVISIGVIFLAFV